MSAEKFYQFQNTETAEVIILAAPNLADAMINASEMSVNFTFIGLVEYNEITN